MFFIGGHIAKLPMAGSALVGGAVAVAILVLRLAHTASRNGAQNLAGSDPQLPGLNRLRERWKRIDPIFEVQFGEYAVAAHDELTKEAELDDGEAGDDSDGVEDPDTAPLPKIVSKASAAARPGNLADALAPLSAAFEARQKEPAPLEVLESDPSGQRRIQVTAAVLPPALGRSPEPAAPASAGAPVAA